MFNPGVSTFDLLVELTREVDFAAFIFARDDWTGHEPSAAEAATAGQASPRDNVVYEAGLFGGALGLRRTFILHANGAKLPTDLLGLTSVRYDPGLTAAEMRAVNQKIRKAIETEGRLARIEGLWWQYSQTARTEDEPSAISLLRISRDRIGGLEVTGEIKLESEDRASGYWTTRSDRIPELNARTSGVYLRADPADLAALDGGDAERGAELIAQRLREWTSIANS